MNDVNLAPENKEATPEHGYLMAYDKKEQKAKGVKGIAANGELETLEANEANRDQFIKVDQRGNSPTSGRIFSTSTIIPVVTPSTTCRRKRS
jgi:hypothetical protein